MDLAVVSLIVSFGVLALKGMSYLDNRSQRKQVEQTKSIKAEGVAEEIRELAVRIEDHAVKIAALQLQAAVCINQQRNNDEEMNRQVRAMDKLADKIEDIR